MQNSPFTIPPQIENNRQEDCLHIFLIHNPVAIIMARMMVEAYRIPLNSVRAVGIRNTNTEMTGFRELHLRASRYDRYVNRITGRNLAAWKLGRVILNSCSRYIVYSSWAYPEVEELVASRRNLGHIVIEEGQQSYYPSPAYRPHFFNNWLFRRRKIRDGSIAHYFREDALAFISMSPEAFPLMPVEKRFVLTNFDAVTRKYLPRLSGISAIGLMPAPRRLSAPNILPAIDLLIKEIPFTGVIKMHPGFLSEKTYDPVQLDCYIAERSDGRIRLCPDDVLLEIEMLAEKKHLYGARTSLMRYAEMFGSSFTTVKFKNYIKPNV